MGLLCNVIPIGINVPTVLAINKLDKCNIIKIDPTLLKYFLEYHIPKISNPPDDELNIKRAEAINA